MEGMLVKMGHVLVVGGTGMLADVKSITLPS